MIYVSTLAIIGLIIYIFLRFGLPKIVSLYASRIFKADVSIEQIDFVRRELIKIRFSKGRSLNMYIQNVKLFTNLFSSTWASLITVKISGLEAKITKKSSSSSLPSSPTNNDVQNDESNNNVIEKIVKTLAFIKVSVTFQFESVYVYVEGEKFLTMNVSKAEVYPETTRSGLLNIISEVDNADIQGPEMAFASMQNTKMTCVFSLDHSFQSELEHVDFDASTVRSNIPLGMVKAKLLQNKSRPKNSSVLTLPNINLNIEEVDLSASYERLSWASQFTHVKFNHFKSDQKFELTSDEVYISDDKCSKSNVFIQQVKLNKKLNNLLTTWNHISVQASVESLDYLYELKQKLLELHPGSWTKKLPMIEDTTLTIEIDSGTIDATEYNLAFHVQQLSSKIGIEKSQAGNSFYLDNFHFDLDKEQNEAAITVADVGMALSEESLNIILIWSGSILSKLDPPQPMSNSQTNPTQNVRWSMRSQSVQVDYVGCNNLMVQLWIESSKSKGQGPVKGVGCVGLSLAINEPSKNEEITVIQVQDMTITQDSDKKESLIKFPNKVHVNWRPLAHRVLYDIGSLFRQLWMNSMLRLVTKSRKSSKGVMTTRILLQKGCLLKAQLQTHGLDVKLDSFDMRKVGEEWKLLIPNLVVDVVQECNGLFTCQNLLIQKSMTNPLAGKFRLEIDGLVDKDNTAIVASMALFQFNFPYQMDIYDLLSQDLMALVKWLRILHGKAATNFDIVHPDILFFIKQVNIEFQDDPFEVCLRDNFELLEDEHFESHKRQTCLENKIEDLKKTHRMSLTSAKIEELFTNLKQKNADIFVKRAKMLRENEKRTRLLSFNLSSMEFMIFSDRSMTGYNTGVDFIHAIDPDSPWGEDLEFISLFYKWVRFECKSACTFLRDYPQNFTDAKHILFWGKVALAEEFPADRAIRTQLIDQGRPYYEDFELQRSLLSFKLYHDLALDMDFASFAHGPCWEPTLSQFSIALSYVTGRSKDPSPPLSWWDRLRLILHGRLLVSVKTLKLQLHTTLDPYNTAEEAELTFHDANFDWTNGQFKILADEMNLYVRTASKYDDCQLLHVPNVVLLIKLDWLCLGDPNDHHGIMPCAKEKIPEYSHNVQHDSYRAIRSQNVNVHLNIETRRKNSMDRPRLEMFSSTMRWMESLKWLFSGASRPIRRGKIFNNTLPPKQSFFRHFKKIRLSVSLQEMQIDYWTSASMTKGVQVNVAHELSLSAEYSLKLVTVNDGLIHRSRSNWTIEYTNCQVGCSDIWFQSLTSANVDNSSNNLNDTDEECQLEERRHIEKSFFFSVEDVQYNRDVSPMIAFPNNNSVERSPTHILTVTGAKGAWTQSNRDMAFSLYDSWRRAHILRQQVSAESLKGMINVNKQKNSTSEPSKNTTESSTAASPTSTSPTPPSSASVTGELSLSSFMGASPKDAMAHQKSVPIVYSEENSSGAKKNDMEAMMACTKDDVLFRNWLIRFINSQMLLKGCETLGHLILSAAKTEIVSQMHMPVWKDQTLVSKSSWSGSLDSMQYFATVIPEDSTAVNEETILWLTKDKIGNMDNEKRFADDLPDMVGSGQSAGGVISQVVGPAEAGPQLQRIVSRCKCEFYYVAYGEKSLEEVTDRIPKRPEVNPWTDQTTFVNAFSLIHHDLDVCTNSLQYSMILDVLNNLILYIEPSFRSRTEDYMRMKYQLMLSKVEDQRKPIVQLHTQIRQMVCQLRDKEKAIFALQNDERLNDHKVHTLERLEKEVLDVKEEINTKSEELDIRQRCLQEFQMLAYEKQIRHVGDASKQEQLRRKSELFFSRAHWKLTETDGQLGIADIIITDFYYTRRVMRDDSVEHLCEMGYLHVKNCLPGQLYTEVIYPTELSKDVPLDRQRTLRVFCREKAPVGGISVKAHFEINLVPLTIGITQAFYKRIMAFCFPEKASDPNSEELNPPKDKKKKNNKQKKEPIFYVESPLNKDDVEEMKVRAMQNKLFVYIKIPEVPICVSYKGQKEKNNILDVANFRLQVPTIEYHNMTWTWLDLLLAVKSQIKDSLLSQAIKQKLSLRHRVDVRAASIGGSSSTSSTSTNAGSSNNDDDKVKAEILFGTRHLVAKLPGGKK